MPQKTTAQIVVVVPAKSTIDSLASQDLQKIFKGQRIKKSRGVIFQIVEFAPVSDAFYKKLYGLDAYSLGKHWLRLIFSGERVLPPKNFSKVDKFKKYLIEHDNSIGFINAALFKKIQDDSIRAIVIDGYPYQHPKYVLKEISPQNNQTK